MAIGYVLYCDESEKEGEYFSNFYGGALVRSVDLSVVQDTIRARKAAENLHGEVKWSKITAQYLPKYRSLVDAFFDLIRDGKVKVRVMFTQNARVATLTPSQRADEYNKLYYQFIKHAFGLPFSNPTGTANGVYLDHVELRLYFDQMPTASDQKAQFKACLASLDRAPQFKRARIRVPRDQIAEVDSHSHDVLQCIDILLGAVQFRLNDKHLAQPTAKRTAAKLALYEHILRRIEELQPAFNFGVTTPFGEQKANWWQHPYRHWLFLPAEYEFDRSLTKRGRKR